MDRGVSGLELSPAFVRVGPGRSSLFRLRTSSGGRLVGLLIGRRRNAADEWTPAIDAVSVEAVVIHGVSLQLAPWRDLIAPGDINWPLAGSLRSGQTVAVCVRNDGREAVELRAVLVVESQKRRRS